MTPVDLSFASVLRGVLAPGALAAAALFLAGALVAGVWPAAGPATKATAQRQRGDGGEEGFVHGVDGAP